MSAAPAPGRDPFTADDLRRLEAAGIPLAEARRQAALLARPPARLRLERPCLVGDGIRRLDPAEAQRYAARGAEFLRRRRVAKFVPASGAATRMFQGLREALEAPPGAPPTPAAAAVLGAAHRLAFFGEWARALGMGEGTDGPGAEAVRERMARDWRGSLRALLDEPGLGYARLPKALLPFHRVQGRPRTALEEHWREAEALGVRVLDFTLSREHDAGFRALVEALQSLPEGLRPGGPAPSRGFQDPATDTLAGDGSGGLFRDDAGRLLLRPGGHGALLGNLQALADKAEAALLRNIDNIAHPRLWPGQLEARRILLGVLDEEMERGGDGPVRVAGMVPNTGEPGGGPFWVQGQPQPQIVESAQVDLRDPAQKAVFAAATHFNPVDMACGLVDGRGRPHDLARYADPDAVFLAAKTHAGRPLVALERPGLWNGSMAHWRSVFVELPLSTFHPVKTVADLLKDAHQEAAA